MNHTHNKQSDDHKFDNISLKLASPERILEWSFGEITKPETINYRTQRSERGGLFDEKIFGPERDFECYCGKYRGIRYRGIVCEKCGVEITRSIVRRERMGHISLATPVSHIWFLRGIPSRIAMILGVNSGDVERVIYFAGYIVTKVEQSEKDRILKEIDTEYKTKVKALTDDRAKDKLKEVLQATKKDVEGIVPGAVLDEIAYHRFSMKFGTMFEAGIGAEAIFELFKKVDLKTLAEKLEKDLETAGSVERVKLNKRLSLIKSMIKANVRPEWMFLSEVPVIPPGLRPMVALTGGRHATSDVNDLYRRVINRNNRLKKLLEIGAPDVILRNEKRILQEAVDALIDNSIRHSSSGAGAMNQAQRRPLKSLSDNLKGKQGLLRQNLLGKRVDYSGRSVIVVGPSLALGQCGLPKHMALELFRPFIIGELLKQELAYNIRGAGKLIDDERDEVWAILEQVIQDKYVLLNRAPTLHRLGIQAFRPILIEGNAIQVHPLVCTAFNADFDGDQMAVHVPLSDEAQLEAREFMASNKNLLSPGTGDPIVSAFQDIVLGSYWMTRELDGEKGEGKYFSTPEEAILAYTFDDISPRAKIQVLPPVNGAAKYDVFEGKPFETTMGRIAFNRHLPDDYPYINFEITKKKLTGIVDELINRYGVDAVPPVLDRIKRFGFYYATRSGITLGLEDASVPVEKEDIVTKAQAKSQLVNEQYDEGLLSAEERYRKNIEIWHGAKSEIEQCIPKTLDIRGSIYNMVTSGARGSIGNITQMAGMKGLIQNTSGETIEYPVISSMKEGLNPIEYFRSTHGSRKGLADTALNTAKAGYLTRKLFVVAQDTIVSMEDCGTKNSSILRTESMSGIEVPLSKVLKGRFIAEDVVTEAGEKLFKKGHFVNRDEAKQIEAAGIAEVRVFSPMTCEATQGICQKCYGHDLSTNEPVGLGEAVGTVAAQAVGEPATQLTMRTFHAGGIASVGGDITSGLPRVEEIFERRSPKNPAVIATISGLVTEIKVDGKEKVIIITPDAADAKKAKKKDTEYSVHFRRTPLVKVGDKVTKGDLLTDGSADLKDLFKYAGLEKTQQYVITETSKIYELQGAAVSRKHLEVIVRQMFSRRKITHQGDSELAVGDIVEATQLTVVNEALKAEGKEEAKGEMLILGISEVSLTRSSFLSAASFQHTTKVLINAAVRGGRDNLKGLMENIIIGRLIPAGTGFGQGPKHDLIENMPKKHVAVDSEEGEE